MKKNYNSYPCGKVPKEWMRPELGLLKEKGYIFDNPQEIVGIFEDKIAKYAGSNYAVAVDSCTNSLLLCLNVHKGISEIITIPSRTYCSVPMAIISTGFKVKFKDIKWEGMYQLNPFNIYDSATRFTKNMYIQDSYQCLSFQFKKRLPISKGGMILTNNKIARNWFRLMRYEGRHIEEGINQWDDEYEMIGGNMYMSCDDAARGILLFDMLMKQGEEFPDFGDFTHYPDLSKKEIFKKYIKGE